MGIVRLSEFKKLTREEILLASEALNEREIALYRMVAWYTSILLSPYTKKGKLIDPNNLLPEFMREEKTPITKEEAKEQLNEIKKSLGVE